MPSCDGRYKRRKDAEGVWQDIDNRLIEKRENNVGLYVSSDERVSFVSKFIFGQPIFSLSENGKTVSLSMISNQLSAEDTHSKGILTHLDQHHK